MKPTPDQRLWMYEAMYRSRRLDDAVLAAYLEGKTPVFHMGNGPLPGEMHQSDMTALEAKVQQQVDEAMRFGRDQVVGRIETA